MTEPLIPRPEQRPHITVDAATPRERGEQRGRALADSVRGGIERYDKLFTAGGLDQATVRRDAETALDAIGEHLPAMLEEIEGIAAGSGAPLWRIGALNARTEILARSTTVPPGECSTILRVPAADPSSDAAPRHVTGIQTWDWHVELSSYWHTLEARGGTYDVVGVTEHGILGKIGVNSAGLALHYNVLGHIADKAGGIPMHVLAFAVLSETASVAEALQLIRSVPIESSGSFSLFDATGDAVILDLSPVGVFEHRTDSGYLLRTNHFLAPELTPDEKTWNYQPGSGARFALLTGRLSSLMTAGDMPEVSAGLLPCMATAPGEAPVTRLPDPAEPFGKRWASLALVILDPATREARVLDGTPVDAQTATPEQWRQLRA